MADDKGKDQKADKKADAPAEGEGEKKGGVKALLTKLPVLIGGVMLVEAIVLFAGFKVMGGGPAAASADHADFDAHGDPAHADDGHDSDDGHGGGHSGEETGDAHAFVGEFGEVPVDSFRAPNRLNGRTYLYDVEVAVRVKTANKAEVEAKLKNSSGLVRDRLNRIVAGIDPEKLNGAAEPGLETFRRQVKHELDHVVGDGLIEQVLVPRCIPYRTDY